MRILLSPNPFMKAYSRPEDEILFFIGTNAENPSDLVGITGVYLGEGADRMRARWFRQ